MFKLVSDYIPSGVLKNPYYSNQKWYKYISCKVLQIYEKNESNKNKYPFSLFTQKYVSNILEIEGYLIAMNHNPKLGWSFQIKKTIRSVDTREAYYINGEYAIYIKSQEDKMVFLFTHNKKRRAIATSKLLDYKKLGQFRKCTSIEKLEILYDM